MTERFPGLLKNNQFTGNLSVDYQAAEKIAAAARIENILEFYAALEAIARGYNDHPETQNRN